MSSPKSENANPEVSLPPQPDPRVEAAQEVIDDMLAECDDATSYLYIAALKVVRARCGVLVAAIDALHQPSPHDAMLGHAIDTAVAYIESGGDWEEEGQLLAAAEPLAAHLDRIPALVRGLRERETALADELRIANERGDAFRALVKEDTLKIERLTARETALTAALRHAQAALACDGWPERRAAIETIVGVLNDES